MSTIFVSMIRTCLRFLSLCVMFTVVSCSSSDSDSSDYRPDPNDKDWRKTIVGSWQNLQEFIILKDQDDEEQLEEIELGIADRVILTLYEDYRYTRTLNLSDPYHRYGRWELIEKTLVLRDESDTQNNYPLIYIIQELNDEQMIFQETVIYESYEMVKRTILRKI